MTRDEAIKVLKSMERDGEEQVRRQHNLGPLSSLLGPNARRLEAIKFALDEIENRKSCVLEVRDGDKVVRYEAPTVEELDRVRLIGSDDTVAVVTLTEGK